MKNIIIIVFMISSCAVHAQEDVVPEKDPSDYNVFEEHVPYWRLEKNWKLTPFDIFSVVPTLGIDHEVFMSREFSLQFGAGVIPSFLQFAVGDDDDQFNWMNGYRLRFESRFWVFRNPYLYASTELSFRHLIISEETSFGMEGDEWGNFAYFINQDMVYHRFSTHINFKMGWQKIFGEKLVFDLYTGLSYRRNNVISGSATPEGGSPQGWWNRLDWTLRDGHKFGYMIPIIGFRIGWHIPAKADI